METPEVVGFFDVNRISVQGAARLQALGWLPVSGCPRDVVLWKRSWLARVWDLLRLKSLNP